MGMTPQHFHTIPTSCAILLLLPHNALCVCLIVVQRVVEGSVVSACWCAWGMGYVVGGCGRQCGECMLMCMGYGLCCGWLQCTMYLLAILSMADMVCLACMQKLWRPWAVLGMYGMWSVWYDGVYVMLWNLIVAEHGRYGSMEDWSEQCWIPCSFSVYE